MAQARETHAELASLRAQAAYRATRGSVRRASATDEPSWCTSSEPEGQRGLAHIGEHVAEEGFMLLLTRTEPRLRDQIAERLSARRAS